MRTFVVVFAAALVIAGCSSPANGPSAGTPPLGTQGAVVATATATPVGRIRSTSGRFGLAQIFDYFPSTGTQMTTSQIDADASRYDMVWGSFNPNPWRTSRYTLPSRYYIPQEDNELISGHNLAWWQTNHPDWILYACDSSGNPTKEIAYTPGVGFPDVPLDIHNPQVVNYQISQSLLPYAIAHNYTAVAIDQVIFSNIMEGGNPELGQSVIAGYYGCGVYSNGTFVRRYTGRTDPQYTTDILNWIATLRSTIKSQYASRNPAVFVNHPAGSTSNTQENQLMSYVDGIIDEPGFSDYGLYNQQSRAGVFLGTLNYVRYLQSKNVAAIVIDRYDTDGPSITTSHLEHAMATYMMGNEGLADLYAVGSIGRGYGYGAEQWHSEYSTNIGAPCADYYGGPSYSSTSPHIYYRRYQNALAVVNSGSLPTSSENATLPTGHTYTDIEHRTVTNPLAVASSDTYVLLTTNGCS